MLTLSSSTGKWIWCIVIIITYVLSNFENTSFSSILKEISADLCENGCTNQEKGFIKTLHYVVKIIVGPVFGLLGDRFSRKYLQIGGLFIWGGFGLIMTFMPSYWYFVITNALSSAGMTVSNNLGPPMIADLFSDPIRGWVLGVYSLGTPIGLGLGMVVPTALLEVTNEWRHSLRLTPGLLLFCAIVIFFLYDPPRGGVESDKEEKGARGGVESDKEEKGAKETGCASVWSDFKYIMTKPPYILQVIAVTCTFFVQSTLNYWLPQLYREAIQELNDHEDGSSPVRDQDVAYIIGILMIVGGIVGIISGTALSRYLHFKMPDSRIDPIIIGTSTLVSLPLICASGFIANKDQNLIPSFVLYGFYFMFANVYVSIGMNFTLNIIAPSKRAFAVGLQKTAINGIGKASSSVLTGVMIDAIITSGKTEMEAIQYAFIPCYALLFIAGVCYILIIFFIPKDIEDVEEDSISMEEKTNDQPGHPTIENLSEAEEGKISTLDKPANKDAEIVRETNTF